jgi:hypothetical protein
MLHAAKRAGGRRRRRQAPNARLHHDRRGEVGPTGTASESNRALLAGKAPTR